MKKVYKIIIAIILVISCFCSYLFCVFNEDKKVMSFVYAYYHLNKQLSKLTNDDNMCIFSNLKMSKKIELSCQPLQKICNNNIPVNNQDINIDTACAIITVDINGFGTGLDTKSFDKKLNDQFLIYLYKNGTAIKPNSIEDKILNQRCRAPRNIMRMLIYKSLRENDKTHYVKPLT